MVHWPLMRVEFRIFSFLSMEAPEPISPTTPITHQKRFCRFCHSHHPGPFQCVPKKRSSVLREKLEQATNPFTSEQLKRWGKGVAKGECRIGMRHTIEGHIKENPPVSSKDREKSI